MIDPMHEDDYGNANSRRIQAVELRVQILEKSNEALSAKVDLNTLITNSIKTDTADLVAFAKTAGGVFAFLGWIGVLIKWFVAVAASIGGVWIAWKTLK